MSGSVRIHSQLLVLSMSFLSNHLTLNLQGENRKEMICLFLRGMFGFCGISLLYLGLEMTSLANYQVMQQTSPVWSAILGFVFLGEPWQHPEVFTLIATSIGVCLIFKPAFIFGQATGSEEQPPSSAPSFGPDYARSQVPKDDTAGIALCLAGSLSIAAANLMIRVMGTTVKVPWPKLCLAQGLSQATLSVPALHLAGQSWVSPNAAQAAWLGACGALAFASQVCMTIGMQHVKAATSSLVHDQTGLVWSFAFDAYLVPGEVITFSTAAGAAVISVSTAWLACMKGRRVWGVSGTASEGEGAGAREERNVSGEGGGGLKGSKGGGSFEGGKVHGTTSAETGDPHVVLRINNNSFGTEQPFPAEGDDDAGPPPLEGYEWRRPFNFRGLTLARRGYERALGDDGGDGGGQGAGEARDDSGGASNTRDPELSRTEAPQEEGIELLAT